MVHAGRPVLDGQPHTGPGAELVAVHPQTQAPGAPGREHLRSGVGVEGTTLAEHIHPAHVRSDRV